jgi:predicted signal transduction protein with EAL and GGDEF domain
MVFCEAASWARRWALDLRCPVQISVNRSPVQFRDQTDYAVWSRRLTALGLPGSAIAVEITEGLLLLRAYASPAIALQLAHYRAAGLQVSIDDFGTGYSPMAYLKKFDMDYLKVDRSFVRDMESSAGDRTITEAIISMAHKLDLHVIAEGIETAGQLRCLRPLVVITARAICPRSRCRQRSSRPPSCAGAAGCGAGRTGFDRRALRLFRVPLLALVVAAIKLSGIGRKIALSRGAGETMGVARPISRSSACSFEVDRSRLIADYPGRIRTGAL